MREIGFWDYTCPGNGSLERYTHDDWEILLDDMAEGGFNSFVLCVKWLTTGYRSRYSWLDQDTNCTAITSDNALIHQALRGARARGLKTWLLVVCTQYEAMAFDLQPCTHGWGPEDKTIAYYDLDCPGLQERIEALFQEVAELFGAESDGLIVEMEFCDKDVPHRIPLYNAWAEQNGRPDYAAIKNITLEPRSYPFRHWRDFTTSRRIAMLRHIEQTVRATGFEGRIATITELMTDPMVIMGNQNLEMLREALPELALVTYDSVYDRRVHRLATMDCCIQSPKALGFEVCYLTRGVMTFGMVPGLPPTDLPTQWQMEIEDAATYRPDILWFMGSDARVDSPVCSPVKLPQWGFPDGRTARLHLMRLVREAGLA